MKIYAPIFTKEIETKYGKMWKQSFKASEMIDFINKNKNNKGFINLDTSMRKETGQFGDTHYTTLDTWEPKKVNDNYKDLPPLPGEQQSDPGEDLPF